MNQQRIVHLVAGSLILTGLLLGHFVNENWLWLSAFVGINLFQSALTNWCLLVKILNRLGVKAGCPVKK